MNYAEGTSVPVEKSRAEIERMIARYGAERFMVGSEPGKAYVAFQVKAKAVRFILPLPDRAEKRFWFTPSRGTKRTESEAFSLWEQACRERWRALALCIKAKLEAVTVGITTFEQEFLAHFVMPDGSTIGERIIPQLEEATAAGRMPALLLGMGGHPA